MKTVALAAALVFLFLSCASDPDVYAPIDSGVYTGSYANALAVINDESSRPRKTVYTPKNEILFYLDRGMINHYAGFYGDSSRDLETAELLIEDAFTKSISQAIGSYIVNDTVKDYPGEDYEDLYVNVFNALNYYHNNDIEGALVEIRRLNEKLNYLADKYEQAREKVLDSNKNIDTRRLPVEASRFSNSALARYLGVLFYRGIGRQDDARIDFEELRRAYELAPEIYSGPVPVLEEEELAVPPGMARLNVIAFTGLSPVKAQENIFIPLPFAAPNNSARLALPKMEPRPRAVQWAEVVLESGQRFRLELIEDMGAVARETFKYKYGLTVLKTTARTITKAGLSAAAAKAASDDDDKDGGGLGLLFGLLGRIGTEITEQADTRISRYFPNAALVGGVNLEPGNYIVTVNFFGNNGLIYSEYRDITVRENILNLTEFICLK